MSGGLAAPRQTPPEVRESFARSASMPIGSTAEEYRRFITTERARQVEIIRATSFRIEE